MSTNTLAATLREAHGKGTCRRLRAQGQMPAVAYGLDMAATALAVSPKELHRILSGERGLNTVVDLAIDGKSMPTLVVDYQIHPVTRALLHADFKKIDLDQTVDVEVKLELTGRPQGVTMGGQLHQVFRKLPVRSRPSQIPVKLEHDVTELTLEAVAQVKDLKLPEGVQVLLPPERTVAAVVSARRSKEDEEAAQPGAASPADAAKAKEKEEPKAT